MLDLAAVDEFPLRLQPVDDLLVGRFDRTPLIVGHLGGKAALLVDRADFGKSRRLADRVVVLAESRRGVDDSGTVLGADEGAGQHLERPLPGQIGEVGEERLIAAADQFGTLAAPEDLRLLLVVDADPRLGQNVMVVAVPDFDVIDIRSDGQRKIRGERPRRGRPGQEVGVLPVRRPEADGDRRIHHLAVALIRLEVRQRRRAARAVGKNLVPLVDQPLIPEALENPPDRLHETAIHRAVAVAEIHPAPHPADHLLPLGGVAQHDRTARLVELVDAVRLDVPLAGEIQLFLHLVLDRQPVAVPAETALDVLATHRLVARHHILDGSGEQVAVVRQPGRERRAVVEDEFIAAAALFERFVKNFRLLPEFEDFALQLREVDLIGNCLKFHDLHRFAMIELI